MATLVQFLAAGVNGAASGSATFVLRGTASSAQSVMYNEFEGLTQPATNVVTLDANGAAEVYVDAYVDVEIKNSAGTTLRTVTVGNSAPLVEVQSTSFKGTDYDGSPANTVGEPITLKAILDKWITSAGAADWQILFNGSATNLQAALAGFAGMFINVKDPTFGAVGDGVTDDTTAILAAIDSATSGGIVFFPPGTYQVTTLSMSPASVTLMGCGPTSSIIRGTDANVSLLSFADTTPAAAKRITGMGLSVSVSYESLMDINESQAIQLDHCVFSGANITEAHIRRVDADGENDVSISNCKFDAISGEAAIQNLSDNGECFISVASCVFEVEAGFTGAVVDGPDMTVTQSVFDASTVESGTYHHVDAESNQVPGMYNGLFTDNSFFDGESSGFVFRLEDLTNSSAFIEENNRFFGFAEPEDIEDAGHIYDFTTQISASYLNAVCKLGSRAGRILRFTVTSGDGLDTLRALVSAETVVVTLDPSYTNGDNPGEFNVVWPEHQLPPGSMCKLVVINDEGGPIDCTLFSGVALSVEQLTIADGGKGCWIGEVTQEVAGTPILAIFAANALAT